MKRGKIALVILLIGVAAATRLVDHWPNVAPIGGLALLAGSYLPLPWAWLVPIGAMLASDVLIGFASGPVTVAVYSSFAIAVLLGRWLLNKRGPWRLIEASLLGSTLFYLITNAAVWKFSGMYPSTVDGLWQSYWLGLPFFRNTLLGDLIYAGGLFLVVSYLPGLIRWLSVRRLRQGRERQTMRW